MYKKLQDVDVYEIDLLNAKDRDLKKISAERELGLSLDEMKKIQKYFKKEKRNPRDIELEALAQSWSEHCCYKTSKPILRKTIFKIKSPETILAIQEDAAVVNFDKEHAYVVKIESHNHPSAIEPYGGAATGIGGILRDVVCMGAQPIALIDPLFFGPLNFPEKKLPLGVKHPQFLFKGVISGIANYGNRVGIPTVSGMVYFDESFVGNCLVNVGCVGIVKKDRVIRSRVGNIGDYYVMVGGLTGRDGIHGVTFASAELTEESDEESRPAVQLGYAIMKEPLMHACIETNEKGLLSGMKDFGGGGLSCVASEMAHAAGKGGVIELDNVLLKEKGLKPWEIWVSESQERMMLSVKPENLEKVLEIFEFWDVPATAVGRVDNSGRIIAKYNKIEILNLDLDFLIRGVEYNRPYKFIKRKFKEPKFKMPELKDSILRVMNSPNIGSKESVIRRYDHEVRANTILKPMQGIINSQTHGDAVVMKPIFDSYKGLSITSDVNPGFCKLDPYWGAASSMEEMIRNLVAVNSIPHSIVDCLNFGNPEKPDRLGDFVKCCQGLYFVAKEFKIPFVSGNVSFYNESVNGSIAPTPTLLGIGIVDDVRKVVSVDLKESDNFIYIIGSTLMELGGSEYYKVVGIKGGKVPRVYPKETKKNMNSLLKSMNLGLIESCHDLSDGGLISSVCEMAFGGNLGVELEPEKIGNMRTDFKLFSESNGRWLVEVKEENAKIFEKIVKATRIGTITNEKAISIKDRELGFRISLNELRDHWEKSVQREE